MTEKIPSQRILLVDDEPMVRDAIAWMLKADGHQVEQVNSGQQALQKLDKQSYDIVFTNHIMRGMTGEALARAIKEKYPKQMVVMITGYGDVLDQLTQETPLVDFTLAKPIDLRLLRMTLLGLSSQKNP
jgi:CheY-like chemotaxis protein